MAADWSVVHDGDLIVGTDLGVYAVRDVSRLGHVRNLSYAVVGSGLPNVPVFTVRVSPRSPNELVAATMGRGVQHVTIGTGTRPGDSSGVSRVAGAAITHTVAGAAITHTAVDRVGAGALASTGLDSVVPLVGLALVGIGVVGAGYAGLGRRRRGAG